MRSTRRTTIPTASTGGDADEQGAAMPGLNWETFTALPGGPEKNFELLCRGIVRQNFGSHGNFRALANQPGVEFHLKVERRSEALGDSGRWWGWQCKWYDLAANGALGSTRRKDIKDSIRKAESHVPGLSDWVLWTRRTLTKADQVWFDGLTSKMRLHLWTGDDVDNNLVGQAAVLRGTYFGELVLTPEILQERHEQAIAPIRTRWQPHVHHVGEAERQLRRMLGEMDAWVSLRELATELRADADAVESSPTVPSPLEPFATSVVATARQSALILDRVAAGIGVGDLDLLRDELAARPRTLPVTAGTAPRKLRASRQRAGLYATNAVAACHDMLRVLGEVEAGFASQLVSVLAPAGCGKTHLAAQLTASTTARPHGVLLHGRNLHANHTLDDLARHVSIAARPVPSMEALLAAVDAAGQRARKRLPIFIDGLNESEDPRAWKPLLAALETSLTKYPHVLLVCTLRPEFAEDALPDSTHRLEIRDYGEETIEAIREHFRYWKIDATDASLHTFLGHPLTLRLFCEVTNPLRQQLVGIGAMPGSLTQLFERYLQQAGVRVVQLASRTHRFYAQDVHGAITTIANKLWHSGARSIESGELRTLLGDAGRPWDQSIVRALEHEGVLLRMPSSGGDTLVPVYDMLGGHIIANALLAQHGQVSFEAWARDATTATSLAGKYDVRHPLADDVLRSLVGQVPRRFHAKQLWQLVDEPLRGRALRMAAHLEPGSLDAETVDALLDLVRVGESELLDRLWQVRGVVDHPLNAEGLDQALRQMAVCDRDRRWTEWIRQNQDDLMGRGRSVLRDLQNLENRWKARSLRGGDRLRSRWVMWTLTSTVRLLRDQATRALYWFGRVDPEGLFLLTTDCLPVNDAYVSERMLAAAYGVVMSHQRVAGRFGDVLRTFLDRLASALVGPSPSAPTQHYLARRYVRGIVAFARKFYPASLPASMSETWSFAAAVPVQPIAKGNPAANEVRRTLHMDFENYTLGRLFDDRRNYDTDHLGHQAAVAHVLGVVWALGWRKTAFDELDRRIADDPYRRGRGDRSPVERYGKKYGWIGFFTYAGVLDDQKLLPQDNSFSDVDIDPSFPEEAKTDGASSVPELWLSPSIESHENWVRAHTTSLPIAIIRRDSIGGCDGPWLAAHGHVSAEDRVLGRSAWAFLSALLVSQDTKPSLVTFLNAGGRPWGVRGVPADHYTFAGEIPWHPNFASVAYTDGSYREQVRINADSVEVEILAHDYLWESYHSDINRAGRARVPSREFSVKFDLYGTPQSFDQFLPDGSPATITLSGVDGLEGDIVYLREDLLRQYAGDRAIVWLVFGERELRPYPPSPPKWLLDAQRASEDAWSMVFTESDLPSSTSRATARASKGTRAKKTANTARKTAKPANSANENANTTNSAEKTAKNS